MRVASLPSLFPAPLPRLGSFQRFGCARLLLFQAAAAPPARPCRPPTAAWRAHAPPEAATGQVATFGRFKHYPTPPRLEGPSLQLQIVATSPKRRHRPLCASRHAQRNTFDV